MTRINAGIPPAELSDKHLLAEHREIKRIPNMVKSGKAKVENIPDTFTLGKGHVKFFYNKLGYLFHRYQRVYNECLKRGFNVTNYTEAWDHNGDQAFLDLCNGWVATPEAAKLIKERIAERNASSSST